MNRTAIIALCLAVIMIGCGGRPEAVDKPQPAGGRLEVASPAFDNGVTARGDVIKHVFELRNTGDAPVKITDTKASCSCTAVIVSDPVVLPGGTASLEVSFNTRGRRGQQSKTVKVFTDSALSPWLSLTVAGDIKPAVAFSEENMQFGQVPRGTTVVREIDLIGLKAEGVSLGELKVSPPDDTRFEAAVVEGSDGRKLRLTFKSSGKNGYFRGRIDAATTNPENPSIFLTVLAEVTGDIVSDPRTAVFPPRGRMTEAEQKTQQIKVVLKSLSGRKFQVKSLKDDGKPIRLAAVNPVEGGVELTLEGPLDAPHSEGVLVFNLKEGEPFEMNYVIGRSAPARDGPRDFKGDRLGQPPRLMPRQPPFKPSSRDTPLRDPRMFELNRRPSTRTTN